MAEKTAKFEVEISESEVRDMVRERVALSLKGHTSFDEDGNGHFIPNESRLLGYVQEAVQERVGALTGEAVQKLVEAEVVRIATEGAFHLTDQYGRPRERKTLTQLVNEALTTRHDTYSRESRVEALVKEEVQKALQKDFAEITKKLREQFEKALETEFSNRLLNTLRSLGGSK